MNTKYFHLVGLLIFAITSSSYSVELLSTPIQDQLKNSILLAEDNWELENNNEKSKADINQNSFTKKEKKSVVKAALYSALLPGLGEHYVGNRTKSKVFFATEAITWISYFGFRAYGKWKKDDMVRYAADKAGASLDGRDDDFFDWVGFYNSTEEFNSLGRVADQDRGFLQGSNNYWQWTSSEDVETYRKLKNSSRTAINRAEFMIVAGIANRIISVIDAIRDSKRHNKVDKIDISDENSFNYKFSINPLSKNKQFSLTILTPF